MQPVGTVQMAWTNNPQFRLWLAPTSYAPGKHKWIKANLRFTLSTSVPGAKPGLHIIRNTMSEVGHPTDFSRGWLAASKAPLWRPRETYSVDFTGSAGAVQIRSSGRRGGGV
jgi:hypothetical protein